MLRTVVLKGVTFQLDIPRTADCAEVFDVMLDIAKKMETALGGVLVDEQQRELSELHLEKINQQIKLIQDQMNARGIPSGCDTALRLFR
jgi:FtsZ-interacting cell division protein ZipA